MRPSTLAALAIGAALTSPYANSPILYELRPHMSPPAFSMSSGSHGSGKKKRKAKKQKRQQVKRSRGKR